MSHDPAPTSGESASPSTDSGAPDSQTGSTPTSATTPTRSRGRGRGGSDDPLRRSRAGGFYVATIGLGIILVLLVIFIVQNTDTTTVNFLGFEADAPVAVLLLIATAAGILLAGITASLRILQLRRRVKHQRKS